RRDRWIDTESCRPGGVVGSITSVKPNKAVRVIPLEKGVIIRWPAGVRNLVAKLEAHGIPISADSPRPAIDITPNLAAVIAMSPPVKVSGVKIRQIVCDQGV